MFKNHGNPFNRCWDIYLRVKYTNLIVRATSSFPRVLSRNLVLLPDQPFKPFVTVTPPPTPVLSSSAYGCMREKLKASSKSVGFILWETYLCVCHFMSMEKTSCHTTVYVCIVFFIATKPWQGIREHLDEMCCVGVCFFMFPAQHPTTSTKSPASLLPQMGFPVSFKLVFLTFHEAQDRQMWPEQASPPLSWFPG